MTFRLTQPDSDYRDDWTRSPQAELVRREIREKLEQRMTMLRSVARESSDPKVAVAIAEVEALEQMLELVKTV